MSLFTVCLRTIAGFCPIACEGVPWSSLEEEEGGEEEWDEEEEDEGRGQLQLRWRGWGMKVRRALRTRCGRLRLGLLCCTFVLFIGTVAAMPLKVDCVN